MEPLIRELWKILDFVTRQNARDHQLLSTLEHSLRRTTSYQNSYLPSGTLAPMEERYSVGRAHIRTAPPTFLRMSRVSGIYSLVMFRGAHL